MGKIALTFDELDPEQSRRLLAAYEQIVGDRAPDIRRTVAEMAQTMANPPQVAPEWPSAPARSQAAAPQVAAPAPQAQPAPAPQAAASPAPQAPPAPGTQVPDGTPDAFGVPYNSAIHSSTDSAAGGKNKDGSWKMKRNLPDKTVYTAWQEKHRRAAAAAPQVQPQPDPAALNAQFGAPPISAAQAQAHAQQPSAPAVAPQVPPFPGLAPQAPAAAPQPPAWPTAAPQLPEVSYALFCAKVSDLSRKNLMTAEVSRQVMDAIGCHEIEKINRDPDLRKAAYAELMKVDPTEVQPIQTQ